MHGFNERMRRRLKLRDLDTLMGVAQAGGMRKAAEQLHMSQAAVSKAIAELEDTLGVRLLDRTSKGVEPTVYGRALLRRGQVIFDELHQGVNEIGFLAEPGVGELSIGCVERLMASLIPAVIDRLHRQHPRLVFKMESGDAQVLLSHFLRHRICEMVVLRPWAPLNDPDLQVEPLFHERMTLVAGDNSPWARRRKLGLTELIDAPWILSAPEIHSGSPVVQALEAQGLALPRNLIVSGSLNLRYSLLATGRYVTAMPSILLKFCPRSGPVKVLPVELPSWAVPVVVITLRRRVLSAVADLFIERLREVSATL